MTAPLPDDWVEPNPPKSRSEEDEQLIKTAFADLEEYERNNAEHPTPPLDSEKYSRPIGLPDDEPAPDSESGDSARQ